MILRIFGRSLPVLSRASMRKIRSKIICMTRFVPERFLCSRPRRRLRRTGWRSITRCRINKSVYQGERRNLYMAENDTSLATLYKGWDIYQEQLVKAITPLEAEQLAL